MSSVNPDALPALVPVVETLEQLGVPYHVGGSFAMSAHGIPRASADVDIVAQLAPEHVDRFVQQLHGHRYYVDRDRVLDAVRRRESFNVIHRDMMVKVDIFVAEEGPFAEQEQSRARRARFDADPSGPAFLVKSPEDLILRKLLWYRLGHEVSERQWSDVIAVIKMRGPQLDNGYLAHWARELRVDDLLDRALRDADD